MKMLDDEFYQKFQSFLDLYNHDDSVRKEDYHLFLYGFMFLKFLEQESFFNQNKTFLRDLYNLCSNFKKDYFKSVIKPIFLNIFENKELVFPDFIIEKFEFNFINQGKIFKVQDFVSLDPNLFTNSFWEGLLELFNNYRWSGDEKNSDKGTLTPTIFEFIYEKNLKKSLGNKRNITGTVFTPSEVINRLIENTIYPYLQDILEKKGCKLNFKQIIKNKVIPQPEEKPNLIYLFSKLAETRILDNSCGGGDFLLNLVDKLLDIYDYLSQFMNQRANFPDNDKEPDFLRIILENNIYGVELSKILVIIVKIRLILTYISYQKRKDSNFLFRNNLLFPNINHNIKQGNSLIGIISKKNLLRLINRNASNEKEPNKKLKSILNKYFGNIEKDLNSEGLLAQSFIKRKINNKFTCEIRENLPKFNKKYFNKLAPFHWIVEFPKIFYYCRNVNREPGFDIIIGNPPYGKILANEEKQILRQDLRSVEGRKGSFNIASIFLERSLKLLKKGGYLGYIVPNTINRKDEFTKIRNILLDKATLCKIIDEGNPFKLSNVTLEMIDLIIKNDVKENYKIEINIIRDGMTKTKWVDKRIFKKYNWFIIHYDEIMDKLNKNIEKLGSYGRFLSAKRPSKLKVKMEKGIGDIIAIKGNCIKPFSLKKDLKIKLNKNVKDYIASLKYPLIILPEVSNATKASICQKDCVPISGVVIWEPNEKAKTNIYFNSYLFLLLNSKLYAFYFNNYIINRSHLTTHLDSTYLERLPIKPIMNGKIFALLTKLLLFLYEEKSKNFELIDFYKDQIMNPILFGLFLFDNALVYELISKIEVKISIKDFKVKNDIEKICYLKTLKEKILNDEYIQDILIKINSLEDITYINNYIKTVI